MYSCTASVPTPISWPVCGSRKWPRSSHAIFQLRVRSGCAAMKSGSSVWREIFAGDRLAGRRIDRATRHVVNLAWVGWQRVVGGRLQVGRRHHRIGRVLLRSPAWRSGPSRRRAASPACASRISARFCLVQSLVTPLMRPKSASLTAFGRLTRALPRSRKLSLRRGQVSEHGDRVDRLRRRRSPDAASRWNGEPPMAGLKLKPSTTRRPYSASSSPLR